MNKNLKNTSIGDDIFNMFDYHIMDNLFSPYQNNMSDIRDFPPPPRRIHFNDYDKYWKKHNTHNNHQVEFKESKKYKLLDEDGKISIACFLHGVKKENIQASIVKEVLNVKAKSIIFDTENDIEIEINLRGKDINFESLNTKFENGILYLFFNKKTQKIDIKIS